MEIIAKFFNGVAAPFIRCRIFNEEVYLLVDTGSNQNLLDKSFFDKQKYDGQIIKVSDRMMTGNGEVENSESIKTAIVIDNRNYPVQMVLVDYAEVFAVFESFLGEKPAGILGTDFLVKYGIILDFGNWCMWKNTNS